jgi:hypothetical protein
MELGKLTLLCINLICIVAVGMAVFWLFMRMKGPSKRRPRVYSEPPTETPNPLLRIWRQRKHDEGERRSGIDRPRGGRRIEV